MRPTCRFEFSRPKLRRKAAPAFPSSSAATDALTALDPAAANDLIDEMAPIIVRTS